MSRITGRIHGFGIALLFCTAALQSACGGGGSGDITNPPPGGTGQVDSLVLNLDSADVVVGDTLRLSAEARDANGQVVPGVQLSYVSSDPAVATVSNDGLVTSVDIGEAEITVGIVGAASVNSESWAAPALAEVMQKGQSKFKAIGVPKVVITPGEQSIDPGGTSQYSVTITKSNGEPLRNPPTISWSVSNPSVASIDNNGLATAAAEGDTRIVATFAIGRDHVRQPSVLLHVSVCGGIFRVASWTGSVDVLYQTSGTHQSTQRTFSIDQNSVGYGTLNKNAAESDADSTVWEGKVTGEIKLNNRVTFPLVPSGTAITSEVKNGPIQDGLTALQRLVVRKPITGSRMCTYDFQYGDFFTWEVTNNQGAPPMPMAGPTGTALHMGVTVGTPPAANEPWKLGSTEAGVVLPGRVLLGPDLKKRSGYSPGTFLGIGMLTALGTPLTDPTFGQASFLYSLTSQ